MKIEFPSKAETLALVEQVKLELTKGKKKFWGTIYYHDENLTRSQVVVEETEELTVRPAIGVAWQWGAVLYFRSTKTQWLGDSMTEQLDEDLERVERLRELAEERDLRFVHLAKNEFAYYPKSPALEPYLDCLKSAMVLFDLKSTLKMDLHFVYELTKRYLGGKPDLRKMAEVHRVFFRNHYLHNGCTSQGIFETKQLPEESTWLSKEIERVAQDSWVLVALDYGIVEDAALDWISSEEEIE